MLIRFAVFILAVCVGTSAPAGNEPTPKGPLIKIGPLQAYAPADWKAEKVSNRLRSHQFRLARVKDDKDDAELAILPDLPGMPEENLQRWKELFIPPDDKTIDEIAKIDRFKVGKAQVTYVDIAGTYLYKDRPLAAKGTPKPNYRMLAVMLETESGVHLVRAVGPAKTMQLHKSGIDAFVKSLK
jgi:hypothetical protein